MYKKMLYFFITNERDCYLNVAIFVFSIYVSYLFINITLSCILYIEIKNL